MKKVLTLSTVAFLATATLLSASTDSNTSMEVQMQAQIDALVKKVDQLEKKQKKQNSKISKINKLANNDNLKLGADFRTAYDSISYKNAAGDTSNNGIFTNRLWVDMAYAPSDNLAFYSTLSYYKVYGQMTNPAQGLNQMDAAVNETANPSNTLRVKEAYFLYKNDTFLGLDVPWTASIGRRPATDGLLVNYREDRKAKSAIGHNINMEFDGASFWYSLENVTDVSGMSLKFCLGRGMSDVNSKDSGMTQNSDGTYSFNSTSDYSKTPGFSNTDLIGVLFNPYDDGQYSLHTVWFYANNLPGMVANDNNTSKYDFKQTGSMSGGAVSFIADGIGDEISDMLDDTIVFASVAYSKTNPDKNERMLGLTESKTGGSIYVGANWPCQLIDDARVGIEYNHGTKNWRSLTYGEDTLVGSKLAVRGSAYEMWFNKDLLGKMLTAQVRYTYIDYKFTGSNAFFGDAGTATQISQSATPDAIDIAQDLRVYLRYRY